MWIGWLKAIELAAIEPPNARVLLSCYFPSSSPSFSDLLFFERISFPSLLKEDPFDLVFDLTTEGLGTKLEPFSNIAATVLTSMKEIYVFFSLIANSPNFSSPNLGPRRDGSPCKCSTVPTHEFVAYLIRLTALWSTFHMIKNFTCRWQRGENFTYCKIQLYLVDTNWFDLR